MMVPVLFYNNDDLSRVFSRTQLDNSDFNESVKKIVDDVKARKDEALFEYAKKFDKQDLNKDTVLVSKEEIKKAYSMVDAELIASIKLANNPAGPAPTTTVLLLLFLQIGCSYL